MPLAAGAALPAAAALLPLAAAAVSLADAALPPAAASPAVPPPSISGDCRKTQMELSPAPEAITPDVDQSTEKAVREWCPARVCSSFQPNLPAQDLQRIRSSMEIEYAKNLRSVWKPMPTSRGL